MMKPLRLHNTIQVTIGAVLILAILCLSPASAVEKAQLGVEQKNIIKALPADMVGEQAADLLSRIGADIKTALRYDRALQNASAEDTAVLRLQIYKLRVRIVENVHLLADELLKLEKEAPQPALREQVEQAFTRITPLLWQHIERMRQEIDGVRAGRTEASPEERIKIEHVLAELYARLDVFFQVGHAHLSKMKQMGMETQAVADAYAGHLEARADELMGRVELALLRIGELTKQSKAMPDDAAIAALLTGVKKSLDANVHSLEILAGLMEDYEMDTRELRSLLVAATRDIGTGLLDTGVAVSLFNKGLKNTNTWLVDKGPGYLIKVIILIVIFMAFRLAARVVRGGLKKALSSSNMNLSELARRMLISTASNLIMIFGILVILSQLGISLGPLLAGLGVAGFIIGFALQDTLGNFAAGVMILLYRPYDVGDFVDVGGVAGKVHKMSLVSTSLLTVDNQLYIIPNSKIWGDVIKNVTAQKIRRVDMVFGISYTDDIPKAESVLNDILTSHDKVLDNPEHMIKLHALNDSSVDFVVRPWVKVDDYWDVYWDVTRTVKMRFDEEKISIPFPQRDVHLYHENSPEKA